MESLTQAERFFFQGSSGGSRSYRPAENGKTSGSGAGLARILREHTINSPRGKQDNKTPPNNAQTYDDKHPTGLKSQSKATSLNNLKNASSKTPYKVSRNARGVERGLERSKTLLGIEKNSWKTQSLPTKLNLIIPSGDSPGQIRLPKLDDVEVFDDSMEIENMQRFYQETPNSKREASPEDAKKGKEDIKEELNDGSDAGSSRFASATRRAEKEANSNWMLDEELKAAQKLFERREHALKIVLPGEKYEDPLVAIERRMEEVRQMSKPRRDTRHVLQRMPAELREKVEKVDAIPVATIKKNKRKGWKSGDMFRWSARMIILLANSFKHRRKYYFDRSQGQLRNKMEKQMQANGSMGNSRSSLGSDMQVSLTAQPELRTKKQIKHVLWLLRATKAFKHLFPAEMEKEVARHTAYEKYDDGRIIAFQGRPPDRFYYIIAGRITLLRQFKLSTGQVTKSMGYLTKGMTTDPEELERQWYREDSLVAKGQVEVLTLDSHAFNYLLHTTEGAPTEFLSSIDLFDNFPVENLKNHHDAFEYTYYGPGKIIVQDSNRTPWLHVVKSGTVKVVRRQPVIDAGKMNESKFNTPRIEELGCGRSASHAEAMIGVVAKQRKAKKNREAGGLVLPQIYREGMLDSVGGGRTGDKGDKSATPTMDAKSEGDGTKSPAFVQHRPGLTLNMEPTIIEYSDGEDTETDSVATPRVSMQDKKRRRKSEWGVKLPLLNIPMRSELEVERDASFHPHSLWLTRGRTDMSGASKDARKEHPLRPAYLQLDELKTGDVFGVEDLVEKYLAKEGLDHMQPALASEAQGVSLLSNGAEVVKISKRFFLAHAANNTMLKVETMYKEYVSEQEAQDMLFEKETWHQYRSALWQRMTSQMQPKGVHDHVMKSQSARI